jgi:glutaconate CoA-transferase, subunit A
VPTEELAAAGGMWSLRIHRWMVDGVIEARGGAHFTSCAPDYGRDEEFQRAYVSAAKDPHGWQQFVATYLSGTESDYQAAVAGGWPVAGATA